MRPRKRSTITARELTILSAIAVVALTAAGALLACDLWISRVIPGGGGFFEAWSSARGFLWQHTGPYEEAAASSAQQLAYRRLAAPGENPYLLTIPFFLLPIIFPFSLISTASTARALWMCFSQAALVGSAFVVLGLIEWRRPRIFIVLYLLLAVFTLYSVTAMLEGTPVLILSLLYLIILFAYRSGRDELAGALVVLCLFRWEVGGPFLFLFAWRIYHEKRWKIMAGFAMTFLVLLVVSLLSYPGWVLPFLRTTLTEIRVSFGVSTASILLHLSPGYGTTIAQATVFLVASMLIYEGAAGRNSEFRRFVWISCLALAATPLLGLRTEISSLVVLHPSLALIWVASMGRGWTGKWFAGIVLTLALVGPWVLSIFWPSFHSQYYSDFIFLFYPLLCIAGLYWTRWWFVRPHRTAFDQERGTLS